jgi:hypothetical protein
MGLSWPAKDPDEVFDCVHDWASRLLVNGVAGDTIVPSNDPSPAKRPSAVVIEGDVVIDAIVVNGNKISYWVSGGTLKSKITLTISTAQGRRYQETITLPIKQR